MSAFLPPNSWDAHVHIFDPAARSPTSSTNGNGTSPGSGIPILQHAQRRRSSYGLSDSPLSSPTSASPGSPPSPNNPFPRRPSHSHYIADPNLLGPGHLVKACPSHNYILVMPFTEGSTTITNTMYAIEQLHSMKRKARAVVTLGLGEMDEMTLRKLHAGGARALRVHETAVKSKTEEVIVDEEPRNLEVMEALIQSVGKAVSVVGWHVDAYLPLEMWANLAQTIRDVHQAHKTIFVADHLACATLADLDTSALEKVCELANEGILYIKISGLNRNVGDEGVERLAPLIKKFLGCHRGERVIFGSDWPHAVVGAEVRTQKVDMERNLRFLHSCCEGNQRLWENVTRDNAARLYS